MQPQNGPATGGSCGPVETIPGSAQVKIQETQKRMKITVLLNSYKNTLKHTVQEKNIKNAKDVGIACQKVCKPGRDDDCA